TLNELKILKNKPENYQFAWVKQNEKTVIRNEADSCILSGSLLQYEIIGHLFSDSYYSFYDTACASGRNDLAMLIIKLSGNINSAGYYKRTFLANAVRLNNNVIADYLLNNGADANWADSAGWTPLHYAAENQNCSVMEKLIACGAKLNCRSGKIQFTRNIFRGKVKSCIYQRVPAEIPASEKSFIYKSNNKFTDSGLTPLHILCFVRKNPGGFPLISFLDGKTEQDPRLNCIRYLLDKGVDINQTTDSGKTPLDYAIYSGDIKTIEFLKANGAVSHKSQPLSIIGKPARASGGMNPAGGILVMKYDKARQTEDCSCYQVNEKLNLLKTTQLKGISETDRNLRYLRHGKLFCLETINHTNNNRLEIYLCLKNLKTDKTQKYLFFSVFTTGKNSGNNDYDISDQIPGAFFTPENEVVVITHPFYCGTCGNMLLINAKKTRSYDKDFIGNRGKDIDLSAILNLKTKPSETGNNIEKMEPIIGYPLNPVFSPDGSVVSYGFYKDNSFKTNIVFCRRNIIAGDVVNWQNILIILKNPEINRNIPIIRKYLNKNTRIFLRDYTVGKQVTDSVKADIINSLNKCIVNDHDLFERVSIGCLNRLPVDGKEYPNGAYYAINGRTMNRLVLEKIFGNSLKRSSVPEIIASSFPVYRQEGDFIKIPHKCWSPAGDKILFTGALEKEYCANVYTIDINSRKIEKVLDVDDSSGNFNPDLEWNENGMAITCKDGIFVMDVKTVESSIGKLVKLPIPQNISDLKNGRISPDGNQIYFFGKKDGNVNLFVYNFADSLMINEIIGNDPDMENYQGTWIYKDRISIIKNEMDYIKPENMK
ncbi:MAG: ankyrin repeat domain-containing protein, partial [Firmicutes bacterium]|nr:ankyrin repeat domain-containing protein [Bacillota bacterium]